MRDNNKKVDELSKNVFELVHKIFYSNSKLTPSGDSIFGDLGIIVFSSVYNHYFNNKESKSILDSHIDAFEIELNNYSVENPSLQTLATGYLSFGMVYHFLRKYSGIEESLYFENSIDDIAFSFSIYLQFDCLKARKFENKQYYPNNPEKGFSILKIR